MDYLLFTFDSDYMKSNFIALNFCSLLKTKLGMKCPKVFFTKNCDLDCECDIMVLEVENIKTSEVYRNKHKLAKIVLLTNDPLAGFDKFIAFLLKEGKLGNNMMGNGENSGTSGNSEFDESFVLTPYVNEVYLASDNIYKLNEENVFVKLKKEMEIENSDKNVAKSTGFFKKITDYGGFLGCKILSGTNWITGSFQDQFFPCDSSSQITTVESDLCSSYSFGDFEGFSRSSLQSVSCSFRQEYKKSNIQFDHDSFDRSNNARIKNVSSSAPIIFKKSKKHRSMFLNSVDYSGSPKICKSRYNYKFRDHMFFSQNSFYH